MGRFDLIQRLIDGDFGNEPVVAVPRRLAPNLDRPVVGADRRSAVIVDPAVAQNLEQPSARLRRFDRDRAAGESLARAGLQQVAGRVAVAAQPERVTEQALPILAKCQFNRI